MDRIFPRIKILTLVFVLAGIFLASPAEAQRQRPPEYRELVRSRTSPPD